MNSVERHSYIDKYLLGQLTTEEIQSFEKELENNRELAQEVRMQSLIIQGFEKIEEEKTRTWLKELDNTIPFQSSNKVNMRKIILISSSIAAAAIIAIVMFLQDNNKGDQLFAQNFQPLPANNNYLSMPRSDESPIENLTPEEYSLAVKGMQRYSLKDYKNAISNFSEISDLNTKNPELFFYLSLSQLAIGKTMAAIVNLEKLEKISDFKYEEDVKWNLALGYLKTKQNSKGISLLKYLTTSHGTWAEPAKLVLKEYYNKN